MARVTLADVSLRAGVSRTTASLVLNNSPSISAETHRRVRGAMKELGYVYNRHAAMLRNQRSMTLGLVVTEVQNPYFAELAMTLEGVVDRSGYAVFVGYSRDDPARQRRLLDRLIEQSVDGLVVLPAGETKAGEIDSLLASSGIPLVLLARDFALDHDYVGADNVMAGRLLGSHLQGLGIRTVAFVGGSCSTSGRRDREAGFLQPCQASDMSVLAVDELDSKTTLDGGVEATRRLLDRGVIPDAIIAYSDVVAAGVYVELTRRGLQPGRDLAVAGFDDLPDSAHRTPPLTTVATFPTRIGEECAELILSRIAARQREPDPTGESRPDHIHHLVEPELRVRASTAAWRPRPH
jgi:LacI family transcriptional regulator